MDFLLFVLRLAALGFVVWGGFLALITDIRARPSRRQAKLRAHRWNMQR